MPTTSDIGAFAAALVAAAVGMLVYLISTERGGALGRLWIRYTGAIQRELDALALPSPPLKVIAGQFACAGALGLLGWLRGATWMLAITPAIPLFTFAGFAVMRHKRREQIALQLDGWLLMLANMLKACGSVGSAIRSSAELAPRPLSEEIDILVKRIDVGTPLDQALEHMYLRVPEPGLQAVITSLRVGRRMGGELPALLKDNAAALREAERIDKFIRSKVSEGRAQLIVLALGPFALVAGISHMEPTFFDPLVNFQFGPHIIAGAVLLWAGALWLGAKIMAVDA